MQEKLHAKRKEILDGSWIDSVAPLLPKSEILDP